VGKSAQSKLEHSKLKHCESSQTLTAVNLAVSAAVEQKALDVRALDMTDKSDIADYFIIMSGTSQRHVQGIAEKLQLFLKNQLNEQPLYVSGSERSDWILLDYGDFVAHIFYEPTRQYYQVDELWKNGIPIKFSEEIEEQARKLRTGIYLRCDDHARKNQAQSNSESPED
jgi:ribosome-associated protein